MTTKLPLHCNVSCNLVQINPRAVQGQTSQDTSGQQVTQLKLLFRHLFFCRTRNKNCETRTWTRAADPQAITSALAGWGKLLQWSRQAILGGEVEGDASKGRASMFLINIHVLISGLAITERQICKRTPHFSASRQPVWSVMALAQFIWNRFLQRDWLKGGLRLKSLA